MTTTKTGADLFRPKTQNRLFQLPKLSDAKPKFEIPNFELQPKTNGCVNCKRTLKGENDFCQSVKVCRTCLSIYSTIETALNSHADSNSAVKREKMLNFWGGVN